MGSAFLEALEVTDAITGAAKAVEIGRQTVYDYMNADPQFLDRCRDAVEGDQVTVFYWRKRVGHKPGKSDALMMYFLKNHDQGREPVIRQLFARRKKARAAVRQPHTSLEVQVTGGDGAARAFGEWCDTRNRSLEKGADPSE